MIGPGHVVVVGVISSEGIRFLGTGFVVSKNKLITLRHVINGFSSNIIISPCDIANYGEYQENNLTKVQHIPVEIIEDDPVRDLCVLGCKSDFIGRELVFSSTDNLAIGDDVGILGYPHCNEMRKVLTFQTAKVGAKVLLSSNGVKSKHVVVNIQSRPGQSGSLVFDLKNDAIIGALIGSNAKRSGALAYIGDVNPTELNLTTYVISAEYIKDML
ncbi:trypsin-like peptidase domain-containing protein [Citrobacter sedlakii]|nr:trypsin-like peptidase domain-containing protein [Citrobacter sedlakii]